MRITGQITILALWLLMGTLSAAAGPLEDGQAALERGDYKTAVHLWTPLAIDDNAAAQYGLSRMYRNGWGVEADDAIALNWARRAVDLGYVDANNVLGALYATGHAVPKDEAKAAKLFRLAAENGLNWAQLNLADANLHGWGVQPDDREAFIWYHRAADQGIVRAMRTVAFLYGVGRGTPQSYVDSAKWYCWSTGKPFFERQQFITFVTDTGAERQNADALKCFERGAAQGFAGADYLLGFLHEHGLGVVLDKAEAAARYRRAAEKDLQEAQYRLALLYRQGEGIGQDDAEAANWFQTAANYGDAKAQTMLGVIYAEGRGLPQNYVLATVWLNQGFANASDAETKALADRTRKEISDKMTVDQRAFAARLTAANAPAP